MSLPESPRGQLLPARALMLQRPPRRSFLRQCACWLRPCALRPRWHVPVWVARGQGDSTGSSSSGVKSCCGSGLVWGLKPGLLLRNCPSRLPIKLTLHAECCFFWFWPGKEGQSVSLQPLNTTQWRLPGQQWPASMAKVVAILAASRRGLAAKRPTSPSCRPAAVPSVSTEANLCSRQTTYR